MVAKKVGYVDGLSVSNAILAKAGPALAPTSSPIITGTPAASETLTASPGTWPSGSTFTYQWFVNGLAIARETRSTYVVRARDAGLPVKVRVTASKVGSLPGESYSNQMVVQKLKTTTTATLVSKTVPKPAAASSTSTSTSSTWVCPSARSRSRTAPRSSGPSS